MTATGSLKISGLRAALGGVEILHGIDLEVGPGEVHVVMGPNGSGKSTLAHALMGRPGTTVTAGSIVLGDTELAGLPSWRRARAGLFLALQQPVEVPGVRLEAVLQEALEATGGDADRVAEALREEADAIGFDRRFIDRALNVDLSGGERKRNEILQMALLEPELAVLDETDSGLDVDALGVVGRGVTTVRELHPEMGVLVVTHYQRILRDLVPDRVHLMLEGRVVESGGKDLAAQIESDGYEAWRA